MEASTILFDRHFYELEVGLRFASREQATEHFVRVGAPAGVNPSPFFMWSWVMREARVSVSEYLQNIPAVLPHPLIKRTFLSVPVTRSWPRGYITLIDSTSLADIVPECLLSDDDKKLSAAEYFRRVTSSNSLEPLECEFFSSKWYNITYPDVRAAKLNPLVHYLISGWREGRDPSPLLSTNLYIQAHSDVREGGINPLLHYANYGAVERRSAAASMRYDAVVRFQSATGSGPPFYVPFEPVDSESIESIGFETKKDLVLTVPFYKREDLVSGVLGSLAECAEEIRNLNCVVVCVNDSPDHVGLDQEIQKWLSTLFSLKLDAIYVSNETNRGFVYSANVGLKIADSLGADCLLLNSDTLVKRGALSEMVSIMQLDDKFGFINPRTNNATIATYGGTVIDDAVSYEWFISTHHLLPRFQIVPVVVGFCLLVRKEIIRLFGYFDSIYGVGYNEENDYIMRANRRGFVSVLANHAYVTHLGEASFSLFYKSRDEMDAPNERVLFSRYPEYKPAVERYFRSSNYWAHRLIEKRVDLDIIFDLTDFTLAENGTTKITRTLLPLLFHKMSDLTLGIAMPDAVKEFLNIELPAGVEHVKSDYYRAKSKLGFMFSQPYNANTVDRLFRTCEKVGFFMLDAISSDCLYLQEEELGALWERVCQYGDCFVFNSVYTKAKFLKRFQFAEDAILVSSDHSLNPTEYLEAHFVKQTRVSARASSRVLIFGNHFEHKGLLPAVQMLAKHGMQVTVFGAAVSDKGVKSFESGQLSEIELAVLWKNADLVVFPSFYEGFGIPFLEAVANQKPLIVMETEFNRALYEKLKRPESVFFFERFQELEELARKALQFRGPWASEELNADDGWSRSAKEVANVLRQAISKEVSFQKYKQRISASPLKAGERFA